MKHEVKIPKRLKMGGHNYSILQSKRTTDSLEDISYWGRHSHRFRHLELNNTASSEQLSETFIHETLHAIDNVYLNDSLEEKQIANLSEGLFQVLEQLGVRFVK